MTARQHLSDRWYGALGVLGVLTALELAARTELIPSRHFPPVTETFLALEEELATATFWNDLASTLEGWGIGLLVGVVTAIPLGIVIGSSVLLYRSLRVPIEFLRPIPSVAVIPVIVLVLGSGLRSEVFLVAFASFWPLFIQTIYGLQDADPIARDTARAFRLGPVSRFAHVVLPGTAPYVATGLRIASSIALVLAVTAELLIGSDGLGRSIAIAQQSGAVELTYALVVATGIVGLVLNSAFEWGERRVLHWHVLHRRVEAGA